MANPVRYGGPVRRILSGVLAENLQPKLRDKLYSLADSEMPGHQYIDLHSGQFRTVVITKGGYPVDTIRAMRDGRANSS